MWVRVRVEMLSSRRAGTGGSGDGSERGKWRGHRAGREREQGRRGWKMGGRKGGRNAQEVSSLAPPLALPRTSAGSPLVRQSMVTILRISSGESLE